MSFLLILKKQNQVRIWTVVNRNSLQLIDFEVGDSSVSTWLNLVFRLQERYKINHLCTDGNPVYGYYKISKKHHITKAETSLVESWNCRLRHYLARLKRKTLCYSKSSEMLRISVLMLLNKEFIYHNL
jgi:insertion element IS1 protein InsB